MPDPQELATQRYYAVPDDMSALGSWCVMNVPKSPVAADPTTGEIQIARYLSEPEARQFADLHNANLVGRPWTRPPRYRVRADDVQIFDELGQALRNAEDLLNQAEHTPVHQPLSEIRYIRGVLGEVLAALNLLTEGAIRLRAQPELGR